MLQNVSVLQVFIASPSDVQEERNAMKSVIDEVNQNLAKGLGIRLELVKWETDVVPGFGADAQDVINKQIKDNFDIFIGILWSRAGTPTGRAESGTIEEFERAYKKYQENPYSVDLLIYFKETPLHPSKIDLEQFGKIQKFKDSLGEKGGLYWTFDDLPNFEQILRGHLSQVTRKWHDKINSQNEPNKSEISETSEAVIEQIEAVSTSELSVEISELSVEIKEAMNRVDEEDDFGFLDYIEIYASRFLEMNAGLEGIIKATNEIGVKITRQTKIITSTNEIADKTKVLKIVKKTMTLISNHLVSYSNILDKNITMLSDGRREGFDALSKSLLLYNDYYPADITELETLETQLAAMIDAKKSAFQSMFEFKDTIANLPKFTSQFNRARRQVIISLDEFLSELEVIEETSINLLKIIASFKDEKAQ